ncbi:MAG: transglycosylase domain-containing protein [Anaerolineae bacterium]
MGYQYETDETPPPRRRRSGRFWRFVRTAGAIAVMAGAAVAGAALIIGLVVYNNLRGELIEDLEALQSMEGREDFEVTRIVDRDGELLYEVFTEGRRTEVTLDEIPYAVRWATIATEDDTFYENPGFDPQSIARAAYEWYEAGEIVSGGSTITQQLVKQIVFTPQEQAEQTLNRKMREAALAYVLTQQLSKDDILTLYLNEVYYGNLAYGIEGAANVYFDKPATELTFGEASFLTGLIQGPVLYDPYTNFDVAKTRQRTVLDLMVLHGYLTPAEADTYFTETPQSVDDLADPAIALQAPHFTNEVRRQLGELPIDPALLSRGGLIVETTIDMDMQRLLETITREQVAAVRDEFNMNIAAIIVLNPHTGEVLAMVGSADYADESIDGNVNVVLSPQQPGSTMKAITYALAFEQGQTAADIVWDVPMAYDTGIGAGYDYEPRYYDGRFHGPVRLRDALANSYNIPAVTVARDVGVANLLTFAREMGLQSLNPDAGLYGLSLTLGGGEVTPLEMAQAYGVLANGGHTVDPVTISRVTDLDGEVLYEASLATGDRLLDERVAWLVSDILADNAARTPAMGADSPLLVSFPAAAKTGTTNDFRDNWTIGYTPHVVVGVGTGNTDNSPMADGVSGLTGAAPLWNAAIEAIYADPDLAALLEAPGLPPLREGFAQPAGLEQRPVCVLSSLSDPQLAEEGCPRTRPEWFLALDPIEELERPTPTPVPTSVDPETGEQVDLPAVRTLLEPGLLAIGVLPMDDEQRAAVEADLRERIDLADVPAPSAPAYCEVAQASLRAAFEAVSLQVFIAAPTDPTDAIRARNWAIANGVPIEPGVGCPEEVLTDAGEEDETIFPIEASAIYEVTSPEPGDTIYGPTPIIGTARWDPERVWYYKLEISQGTIANEWITFGETHEAQVSDGVLEILNADALPPGPYTIRLVLVRRDGNFLQPILIPVTISDVPIEEDDGSP